MQAPARLLTGCLSLTDTCRFYRSNAIYNGSIVGLPIGGRNYFLYYRRDVLAAAKLPVPATWDDLLLVAQTLNGSDFNNDGRPDYAMCLQIAGDYCFQDANAIIPQIFVSYTQVKVCYILHSENIAWACFYAFACIVR